MKILRLEKQKYNFNCKCVFQIYVTICNARSTQLMTLFNRRYYIQQVLSIQCSRSAQEVCYVIWDYLSFVLSQFPRTLEPNPAFKLFYL